MVNFFIYSSSISCPQFINQTTGPSCLQMKCLVVIYRVMAMEGCTTQDNIHWSCLRERIDFACCIHLQTASPPHSPFPGKGDLWLEKVEWEKRRAKKRLIKDSSWQKHKQQACGVDVRGLGGPKCLIIALILYPKTTREAIRNCLSLFEPVSKTLTKAIWTSVFVLKDMSRAQLSEISRTMRLKGTIQNLKQLYCLEKRDYFKAEDAYLWTSKQNLLHNKAKNYLPTGSTATVSSLYPPSMVPLLFMSFCRMSSSSKLMLLVAL